DVRHLQAAATVGRDPLELRMDPAPRGADPAGAGEGVGEGVPGAEGDEGADVPLHARGGYGTHDLVNARVLEGGDDGGGYGGGGRGSGGPHRRGRRAGSSVLAARARRCTPA